MCWHSPRGNLKHAIEYVGIACATDLMSTSLPPAESVFSIQPWTCFHILSFRYLKDPSLALFSFALLIENAGRTSPRSWARSSIAYYSSTPAVPKKKIANACGDFFSCDGLAPASSPCERGTPMPGCARSCHLVQTSRREHWHPFARIKALCANIQAVLPKTQTHTHTHKISSALHAFQTYRGVPDQH